MILGAQDFRVGVGHLMREAHDRRLASGFEGCLNSPPEPAKKLTIQAALMMTELAEVVEAARQNIYEMSDKIPTFLKVEEELADVLIRVIDAAEYHSFNIAEAVLAKMEYNRTRPYCHGGKSF